MKIDLFVLIEELIVDGLTKAKYEAILRMNAHIPGLQEVLDKIREAETAFLTDAVKLKELYTSVLSFGASRENLEDLLKYMNLVAYECTPYIRDAKEFYEPLLKKINLV